MILNEGQISVLKKNGIDPNDVSEFDERKQIVTFNSGVKERIVERWTRVMGYLRPKCEFNDGKKSEAAETTYIKPHQQYVNDE